MGLRAAGAMLADLLLIRLHLFQVACFNHRRRCYLLRSLHDHGKHLYLIKFLNSHNSPSYSFVFLRHALLLRTGISDCTK
jgi:hypothetical protein